MRLPQRDDHGRPIRRTAGGQRGRLHRRSHPSDASHGLQVYSSILETSETLLRDGPAAALANSSNVHVFALAGQPVAEAWLDHEPGGLGTPVEAHTVALIRGGRNPEAARDFVDFLLSAEVQSLLARLYGETPVKPDAQHGWVRPLREIRRLEVPIDRLGELLDSTVHVLAAHGFRVGEAEGMSGSAR